MKFTILMKINNFDKNAYGYLQNTINANKFTVFDFEKLLRVKSAELFTKCAWQVKNLEKVPGRFSPGSHGFSASARHCS